MQNALRCGTSGWLHDDWNSVVYPAVKPRNFHPLEYLSQRLDVIEIDASFHQPLRPEISKLWLTKVAQRPNFLFTAILGKQFTHDRRLDADAIDAFKEGLWPLRDAKRLGCLLMRFPESFRFTRDNRQFLIELRRAFHEFPLVAELPHASWKLDEALGTLMDYRVGFCNIDPPSSALKPDAIITAPTGYVRLGASTPDHLYSQLELAEWQSRAARLCAHTTATFVVTANHVAGKAMVNAMQLKAILGETISPMHPHAHAMPPRREHASPISPGQLLLKAG